jgi:transcriptional regulator with XRE-family HTH domain
MANTKKTKGAAAPGPFDRLKDTPKGRRLSERERVLVEATENLARAMESRGVNHQALADLTGWTRSMVSRLLSGGHGCTVRSLTDAFHALGYEMVIGYRLPTGLATPQPVPRERVPKAAKRARKREA